jgi:hypothetical protein
VKSFAIKPESQPYQITFAHFPEMRVRVVQLSFNGILMLKRDAAKDFIMEAVKEMLINLMTELLVKVRVFSLN